MKKLKLLAVALLSCICAVLFSACEMIWTSIYITGGLLGWAVSEANPPKILTAEVVEDLTITSVEEDEDGWYAVMVEGAIKNTGDMASDSISARISFYDENGYLLENRTVDLAYIGAGETANVYQEYFLPLAPTSVKVKEITIEGERVFAEERKAREKVEILSEGTLSSTLGEDGLYHTTVTGKVKLVEDSQDDIVVCVALYDADGYMHFADWHKTVLPNAEREFVLEYVSKEEIVSHKILYGTVEIYYW